MGNVPHLDWNLPTVWEGWIPAEVRAPGGDITVLALLLYPEYRDRSTARPGMVKVWAGQGRVGSCIFGADQFGNYIAELKPADAKELAKRLAALAEN
jgi:hypothetical protein